nr:hypothetical protein [Tanacetum cinerariifolium]
MRQPQSSVAQQITTADQLVNPRQYQLVGKCNNKAILPNIPCPKEFVYIQQFWKTVRQVPNANETIHFMVDNEEITYTVNMFCSTLKLPVETLEQPFIPLANFECIQPFLRILGYQGILDKVSVFFTKNLTQPWQTMFKVFKRCLTSRLTGHDQTKINVLYIFHVVINKVHVDYSSLIWWDLLHYIQHKKNLIQYPHFTKLIIIDIMEKFELIPKILEEDYHTVKDDTQLVNVYTTREVTVRRMKKKGKRAARETSSPIQSLKIRIKQQKPPTITPLPPSDDQELEERLLKEDIEKLVDENEESTANEFADTVLLSDEDSSDRLEPQSHKEKSKNINDDDDDVEKKDDDDDHTDHVLIRTRRTGSSEIRVAKMQTPIPSPPRSFRNVLSLDKAIAQELTVFVTPTPDNPSQDQPSNTTSRHTNLAGLIAKMSCNTPLKRKHGV